MDVLPHYEGEKSFKMWAESRPLQMKDCKTLDRCVVNPHTRDLHLALKQYWVDCPVEALAVITGMCALHRKALKNDNSFDFVSAWGASSRKKERDLDINEARFGHWLQAHDWACFFEYSQTGMRVLSAYKKPFDVTSIYRWVRLKVEDSKGFIMLATQQFYYSRFKAEEDGRPVNR